MNQLIKFWEKLDINQRKLVHPEDIIDEVNNYTSINKYDDYINNNKHFGFDKTKFHLNLIPIPYIGDIKKARIFILMLNAGFGILDYYAEFSKDTEIRNALINNLRQENFDDNYPFIFLNPKYLWHGGGQYYGDKFKELIQKVKGDNSCVQALSHIAKRVAVLQLVPYHSKKYYLSTINYKNLQSPKIMTKFIEKLKLEAKKGEKCIICARGKNYWKLKEDINANIIVFSGNQPRAAHFSEKNLNKEQWEKISEFLK